ncbi:MAG: hypothetical protein ACM3SW_04145 [Actinomycetota bacterium]
MRTYILLCAAFVSTFASAQQTILNSPSADVMGTHQLYFRSDSAYFPGAVVGTEAPNFIYGLGHNIEAGININAFATPADTNERAIVPNAKWKFLSTKSSQPVHFDMYLGDQLFVPTFHRTFNAGNFLYAAGAISHKDTRFTFGGWDSESVVAPGNRGGELFGLEQTVAHQNDRNVVTLAADWQSGRGANGALALGVMFFPNERLMIIPAFQIANSGDHAANGPQLFIGYLLRK